MTTLQEARALVAQLEPGVRVIVTVDGRDIDCQVHRRSSSEPGGFGHPDSARVTVGFGPGRWNMEVTAQSIADGFATIRIVEWDDESTQVDQDDDGEGGVIEKPTWPDGCPLTLNELPHGDVAPGHVDCRRTPEKIAQRVLDNHVIRDDWRRSGAQIRDLIIEAIELDRDLGGR